MPEKGTMLKFKNYHRGEKVPFVIYADFESCIKSIHTCDLNPKSSYTKQYQKHEPIIFYYYIKCFNSKVYLPIKERSYTGKNAEQVFLKYLEEDIKMIANIPKKKMRQSVFPGPIRKRRLYFPALTAPLCNFFI